jgi:hypothetical protein
MLSTPKVFVLEVVLFVTIMEKWLKRVKQHVRGSREFLLHKIRKENYNFTFV